LANPKPPKKSKSENTMYHIPAFPSERQTPKKDPSRKRQPPPPTKDTLFSVQGKTEKFPNTPANLL
jgi:hypothetical protein